MKKQIESEKKIQPIAGVSLMEIQTRLVWFGVSVSVPALRQAMSELKIEPVVTGRGRSGRGRTSYYDYSVLWLLAAAYHAAYGPKGKFATIAKRLTEGEYSKPEKPSIAEYFDEGAVAADGEQRNHRWLRHVYMAFVTDERVGLDLRVVNEVAQSHAEDAGLGDREIHDALLKYKRQTLARLGVPPGVTDKIALP